MFTITVTVLGGLGLFLYGMKIMSEGLQSAAGEGLKNILWKATSNRFKGVLTGFGITAVIQSSSATTVMLVSFVSAGLINLTQAAGIVFGANIGTTVTGWLVAIIGFKFKIASLALPAIAAGFFVRFINNDKAKNWGEVTSRFGILFLGLSIMSDSVKELRGSEVITGIMCRFRADSVPATLMVTVTGTAVTMVIQSSSAVMAMTMTLAVNGFIDFYTASALILGENIGTTITANLAAVGSTAEAKRTARVHMLFNLFGVIWVMFVLRSLFIPFIDRMVPGDPFSASLDIRSKVIADHMAAFHSGFNIINTIIFLPFINVLVNIAKKIVPDDEKVREPHLKYISTVLVATPSINIGQARLEMERMMEIAVSMFDSVIDIFTHPGDKLGRKIEEVLKMETQLDMLEKEISDFLVKVSRNNLGRDQSDEISTILHKVSELESIGDQCEAILKQIRRKYDKKLSFSETAKKEMLEMAGKTREILGLVSRNISSVSSNIMKEAEVIENRINELKRELRKQHVKRLNAEQCEVETGIIFIDMLSAFEKIGDHAYNISEIISGLRIF
jgi:phosphate:Na+ symporter